MAANAQRIQFAVPAQAIPGAKAIPQDKLAVTIAPHRPVGGAS